MGLLDILHSFAKYLPEIKDPVGTVTTRDRLLWTGVALVLFFMLYDTTAYGVNIGTQGLDFLQTITASRFGSLLTTGIGPIVFASIFLQLFSGAGLIKLNMQDKKERKKFLETQKVLAIILAVIEAILFVIPGRIPLIEVAGLPTSVVAGLVVVQIAFGSIIVLFLDELVTKYGLGSGISLFIAAGVSLSVVQGLVVILGSDVVTAVSSGGAEALPNAVIALLPFIFTIIVFMIVVYAESLKVEIPIAFEKVRGSVPKLPLKFFYVSNIPVIFATALIANMQLFAGGILVGQYWQNGIALQPDIVGNYSMSTHGIMPMIGYVNSQGQLHDGLLYLLTPVNALGKGPQEHWNAVTTVKTPVLGIPEWVHAIVYILFLCGGCILFGLFWVEISNMDAKSVANQLSESGIQIPGFRRDPRMLESILNKHIYPLTVMGAFSVGLLAGLADFSGALGTGTGILLSVGILHKMYEQLEQMKTFELYPSLGKLVGQE